jgi:adenine-specific DNA-methyltransferase
VPLHFITKTHRGRKLIYIDPPYNTGNDFGYNDKFNHSWLSFMKTRLQMAKKLLTVMVVWIFGDEVHYLKILADMKKYLVGKVF